MRELQGVGDTSVSTPSTAAPPPPDRRLPADPPSFLAWVTRRLSGALHADRAVELVLELLVEQVVDWAQVTLRSAGGYSCRFRPADGAAGSATVPAAAVPDTGVLGRTLRHGVAELVPVCEDSADGAALASAVPAPAARSGLAGIRPVDVLCLPLTARGATYGALTLARRAGQGFDEPTLDLLTELAERVSVGLDTARMIAESRRVATVLSRDLAPRTLPALTGVQLATYHRVAVEQEALGGDFYDVQGASDDWTAVVGDVCGKGVEAATLTGRVRQSVRTAALVDRSPARVLDLVNRALLADAEETFVTAICARGSWDGERLRLELASAGHPRPWLVRRDGTVEQVPVSGVVLGLLDDAGYVDHALRLDAGDTLLMYTDGVVEAPGRRDRFGDDRLRDVLVRTGAAPAPAIVEAVAVAVSAHLGDRRHDDIALLGVQAGPTE